MSPAAPEAAAALSLAHSEVPIPAFVTNRCVSVQRLASVTCTLNVALAVLVLPALSLADALSVLPPSAKVYAAPVAPGQVELATPERLSVAPHEIETF